MSRSAVERWASKMLLAPGPDGSSLTRVELRHAAGKGEAVTEFQVDASTATAAKLGAAIYEAAELDAEGLGGMVQRYVAHAYFGEHRAPGRCTIRIVREDEAADGDAFNSEPASSSGALAQMMRHNEAVMRIGVGASQVAVNQFQKLIETQASRISELEEQLRDARTQAEAVSDKKLEHDAARRREEREERQERAIMGTLQTLFPVVLAKLNGGALPALPPASGDAPADQAVNQLLESVTEEQFARLQTILRPDQLLLFMHLYETKIINKGASLAPGAPDYGAAGPARPLNGHGPSRGSA